MKLDQATIARLAEHLENAELQAHDVVKITDEHPGMDWDDAYAVQDAILARKLARGARVVGLKAGLTSPAKMKQMGVTEPVFGFLVDAHAVAEGAAGIEAFVDDQRVLVELRPILDHQFGLPLGARVGDIDIADASCGCGLDLFPILFDPGEFA